MFDSSNSLRSKTAPMIEGALCIALAAVLSRINLFALPQGGSVDLELVPLFLVAWRWGAKWGCAVGALTGVVKILLGGFILNPLQAILDYPLAYACVGMAGMFTNLRKGQLVGAILAAVGQISCHILSSAVFFAQYAPEGESPWGYSIAYNTPVIALKYTISTVAAYFLWRALQEALSFGGGDRTPKMTPPSPESAAS